MNAQTKWPLLRSLYRAVMRAVKIAKPTDTQCPLMPVFSNIYTKPTISQAHSTTLQPRVLYRHLLDGASSSSWLF